MEKLDHKNLVCPSCKMELVFNDDAICNTCNIKYPIKHSKYYFLPVNKVIPDKLDRIKHFLKQFSGFYNFLITLISPVYIPLHLRSFLKKEFRNGSSIGINLGSGNSKISNEIVNVDLYDYSNVDLICDISNLPFKNESVDLVVNIAVLEHIQNPQLVVKEIFRVLKPKGKIYIYIPFIQGYHASPHDYQRYTVSGINELFKDFTIIETKCGSGPTSGLLWILQEWLAIILSFGIKPLYHVLYILIMAITFPLKFIDVLLIHHPFAKNIASGFTIIAEKD